MAKTKSVYSLEVVLTAGCNLSCSYCYQDAKQPSKRMDWDTLRAAIDLLFASEPAQVKLGFYGGEPLLRFELIRQAVDYVAANRPSGKRLGYYIVTNGTLIGDEQARLLSAHRFDTQLSFDGIPAAQAQRGEGTFPILDSLVERLRREFPLYFQEDLRVSAALQPATVCYMADSFEYFLSRGLRRVDFSVQVTDTSDWRVEQIDELESQIARIYEVSLRHYERTGDVVFDGFRRRGTNTGASFRRGMCGVGKGETLTVDVDGEVHGCVMFADSFQRFPGKFLRHQLGTMKMGNLKDAGFPSRLAAYPAAARALEIFDNKQDKYSSYGRCRDCAYLRACTLCPVSIANIPGNSDPRRIPDFACAYNLAMQKYRQEFPVQGNPLDFVTGRNHVPGMMEELLRAARAPGSGPG